MEQLNFVMIPLMAPGHIIPMIDMAKLVAQHGVIVTVILTPQNVERFRAVVDRAILSGLQIQVLEIRFPCEEAGLPAGCESADDLPTYDLIGNFLTALELLQKPLEQKMLELKPSPSCIICDKFIHWLANTSNKFSIPRIIFDGMSCFTQLVTKILYISRVHESVTESEPFVVPDLPHKVEFTRLQLPGLFNPGPMVQLAGYRKKVRASEDQAYGVVVNSFEELEKEYVNEFRKVKGGKVWCIGPLSLANKDNLDKAQRGNEASIDKDRCLSWLDSHQPESVIYACLGSLGRLSPSQFIELALGLEASKNPFILVVKTGSKSGEIEKWILEEGFEERIKQRGLLIRGWAPQVLILSHKAVGAFLTHCGWNSTLEGVCAGVPMVTWPLFGEQFLNEKLVVRVLKTGVRAGAKAVVHLGQEETPELKVTRYNIEAAICRVMDKGKEGCEKRERAQELAEMARRSVEEGGSSTLNLIKLIQDIAAQQGSVKNKVQNLDLAAEIGHDSVGV